MQNTKPNQMTVSEVARELCVSEATVRNLEGRGILPAARLSNGTRLFERAAVDKVKTMREKTKNIEYIGGRICG